MLLASDDPMASAGKSYRGMHNACLQLCQEVREKIPTHCPFEVDTHE